MYDPAKHSKNQLLEELQQLHKQLGADEPRSNIPLLDDFLVTPPAAAGVRQHPNFSQQVLSRTIEQLVAEVITEVTPLITEEVSRRLTLRLHERMSHWQPPQR